MPGAGLQLRAAHGGSGRGLTLTISPYTEHSLLSFFRILLYFALQDTRRVLRMEKLDADRPSRRPLIANQILKFSLHFAMLRPAGQAGAAHGEAGCRQGGRVRAVGRRLVGRAGEQAFGCARVCVVGGGALAGGYAV